MEEVEGKTGGRRSKRGRRRRRRGRRRRLRMESSGRARGRSGRAPKPQRPHLSPARDNCNGLESAPGHRPSAPHLAPGDRLSPPHSAPGHRLSAPHSAPGHRPSASQLQLAPGHRPSASAAAPPPTANSSCTQQHVVGGLAGSAGHGKALRPFSLVECVPSLHSTVPS